MTDVSPKSDAVTLKSFAAVGLRFFHLSEAFITSIAMETLSGGHKRADAGIDVMGAEQSRAGVSLALFDSATLSTSAPSRCRSQMKEKEVLHRCNI